MKSADDVETRRICDFLRPKNSRPPNLVGYLEQRISPDTELTSEMKRIAAASTPFKKARILQVLLDWRILGTQQMFVDALIEASTDANAFQDETDDLGSVSLTVSPRDDPNFEQMIPRLESNRWADIVTASRSPRIQAFFLNHFGGLPDENRLRKLAALVRSTDADVQLSVACFLSRALKEPEMEPRAEIIKGVQTYVNMNEIAAFWSKRFKLDG